MNSDLSQKIITKGWKRSRLGDVADIANGKTNTQDAIIDGEYPFFDRSVLTKRSSKFLFDGEAIILPGEGAEFIPKYFIGKFDLHQRAYAIFAHKEKIYSQFLYQFLFANRDIFAQNAVGSTVKSLRLPIIQKVSVNVPPLSEQKKIAEILSTADDEIQKTDEIISRTERLKKGLMQQLFTKGIGHKKFKKTEIGTIPEGWKISKLSEVAKVERGKFSHRPRNAPEFYGGDIPFIQTGDVVNSNGKISSYTQTLNEKGLSVSRLFKKGTIVITIAANIGDTGILQFDSCFPDSLIGITPSEKIDFIFLEYYLRTQKEYLNSISTQSAQKNINLEKLNPLLVVLPAKDEQRKIADILSSVDEKISVGLKYKDRLSRLKKGLARDLLSGGKRTT